MRTWLGVGKHHDRTIQGRWKQQIEDFKMMDSNNFWLFLIKESMDLSGSSYNKPPKRLLG